MKNSFKKIFLTEEKFTRIIMFLSQILGILFVIPLYAIIGNQGGALYSYAITIYNLFIVFATAGIPLSLSKLIGEYQTLGYYSVKKRVFKIGRQLAFALGFLVFVILLLIAPILAKMILGDLAGGNTIRDVVFVIRMVSVTLLISPMINMYRAYFDGHRISNCSSASRALEQVMRIVVIIISSFISLKIFKLSISNVVGIGLIGGLVGCLITYFYLVDKTKKYKKKFDEKIRTVNEPLITDKLIWRKIIVYAVPFVLIDIFKLLYNCIDMVTVVRGLVELAHFSVEDAETIVGMLLTWCLPFNAIVVFVGLGVIGVLVPNLRMSIEKKDYKDMNKKINQGLSILLFLTLPITIGISFLAEPIWMLFYGVSKFGASVLAYMIFAGLFMTLFIIAIEILQVMKDYKIIFIGLIVGLIIKILLNKSMIGTFYHYGLPGYYGAITASILSYLIAFVICLIALHIKYKVEYEQTVKSFMDTLCGSMVMLVVLFLLKFLVPLVSSIRIVNIFIVMGYIFIGAMVYVLFLSKIGTIKYVFGKDLKSFFRKSK